MQVEITEGDIRAGKRNSCSYCPIALAINRLFPEVPAEMITAGYCFAEVGDDQYRLAPESADFIARFDAGLPVKPISFELYPRDYY